MSALETRASYLALSRAGRVVAAFDSAEAARAFAAKRRREGVHVELVEKPVTRSVLAPELRTAA